MTGKFSPKLLLFPELHQTMTQPYITIVLIHMKFTAAVAFKSLLCWNFGTHANIKVWGARTVSV
jgi:hypothetical protein